MFSAQTEVLLMLVTCKHTGNLLDTKHVQLQKLIRICSRLLVTVPVSKLVNTVQNLQPCIYCKDPLDLQALELGKIDQSGV